MVALDFVEALKMTAPFYLLSSSFSFHGAGYCDIRIMMLLLSRGTDHVNGHFF
jgi:hypothetical protein